MTSREVLERHEAAGRYFDAGGLRSFVREEGDGEPVVCLHGIPSSSFLYRKLNRELAARGLRGVAFDLPGQGLAHRPPAYDYSWTGLGRFARAAVDALEFDRFHLVVHDIGGPVGFELAAAGRERVLSLTVLNAMIEVDTFKRPWFAEPYARRGVGELLLATTSKPTFRLLWRAIFVADASATPKEEVDAYFDLWKRGDGGKGFLTTIRGFERTREKRDLYVSTLRDVPYPVQVVWGARDPALRLKRHGADARRAAGLKDIHTLPAKHFLQEEQAPAIAERVAEIAGR